MSTRTPYTSSPAATSSRTIRGTSSRRARREAARAGRPSRPPRRRRGELRRRARRPRARRRDDGHAVAHELDLGEQVGVQQHGDAALAQRLEQRAHGPPPGRVERARRLVEQQQPRLADERLGEPEPLLHALRHRPDAPPGDVGEPDQLEQLARARRRRRRAREPLVELQQLVGGAPVGEAEQLGEVAERALGGRRSRPARRRPSPRPPGRAHEPAGDLDERRLAGAVGSEQADELALADLEVDAAQRVHRPVGLARPGTDRAGVIGPRIAAGC